METTERKRHFLVTSEAIINLLGVVYAHRKTHNGGDLYLTRYGLKHSELLEIRNWFDKEWFTTRRERLSGTSSVYRVPTKTVNGRSIQLVVKNCRVGEDVPLDTHTLYEFLNAEFNSPWEEFSLVMELREGEFGPKNLMLRTQRPLAIYVPPERFQLWQTGRSRDKINKITRRHPGVNLDILRQYKLVYQWIEGLSIVEAFQEIGISDSESAALCEELTNRGNADLAAKGYVMADMKPTHIIIEDDNVERMRLMGSGGSRESARLQADFIRNLVLDGQYSVVDYELLLRTEKHEEQVKAARRHTYLGDQRDRFLETAMPAYLHTTEVLGVPYVHGHVESTGGLLWVVGRNPRLFDFFLPERWRRTPCRQLSERQEIYYTLTKDNVHIVWKTSRVGETLPDDDSDRRAVLINERGFNSPFEEFAIAHELSNNGIPAVYIRAIYMTGNTKIEPVTDPRRYDLFRKFTGPDDEPILRENHNYISIRGYYNGPDSWVATQSGRLYTPYDLASACTEGILNSDECTRLLDVTTSRLKNIGYDGSLLELNDILIAVDPEGTIVKDAENLPEARICNLELIAHL